MEQLFTYEFAKEVLVLSAYWLLIWIEIYFVGYVIVYAIKWIVRKVKKLRKKKNHATEVENKEE